MTKNLTLLALFSLLFSVACTKKREMEYEQGQDYSLYKISDYEGKVYKLWTTEKLHEEKLSTAPSYAFSDNEKEIKFEIRSTKSDSDLIPEDFQTKSNKKTEFEIHYKFNNHYLLLYKVGKVGDFSITERPTLEKFKNGKYGIPVIAYRVELYNREKKVNHLNEQTNKWSLQKVHKKTEAQYFKADFDTPIKYKAVSKVNLIPASFFEGEWFFSSTVVDTDQTRQGFLPLGLSYARDDNYESANRVFFSKNEKSIAVKTSNVDSRIKKNKKNELSFSTVMTFKEVQWVDYKLKKDDDGRVSFEEEEINNKSSTYLPWKKRKYVKIDFNKIDKDFFTAANEITDFDIDLNGGYFSFVLIDRTALKQKLRFSFRRAHKPKKGSLYYKKDQKYFGIFKVKKNQIQPSTSYSDNDFDSNIFRIRFMPKDGVIKWRFTNSTPKDKRIRDIGRRAIKEWDKVFKEETGIRVKLVGDGDPKYDVDHGDNRYNSINLIKRYGKTFLFGYGPAIPDPLSGEIISATANVYLTTIKDYSLNYVRFYIKHKIGLLAQRQFPFLKVPEGFSSSYAFLAKDFINKIEKHCSELVDIADKMKAASVNEYGRVEYIDKNFNKEAIDKCADEIYLDKAYATLLHELGHTFGLRHNFKSSTDFANFNHNTNHQDHKAQNSSVMDYEPFEVNELTAPGKYDRAAIRFNYANKIEVVDSLPSDMYTVNSKEEFREKNLHKIEKSVISVSNMPIEDILNKKSKKIWPYSFCTDDDLSVGINSDLIEDILCAKHDYGQNLQEIALRDMHSINKMYSLHFFKDGRANKIQRYASDIEASVITNYVKRLPLFYANWRSELSKEMTRDKYLENIGSTEYESFIKNDVLNGNNKRLKSSYQLSNDIYNYIKNLAQMNDYYCIVEDQKTSTIEFVAFSSIQKEEESLYTFTDNENESLTFCHDKFAMRYFQKYQMTYLNEVGLHLQRAYSKRGDKREVEKPEIFGTRRLRRKAFDYLESFSHSQKLYSVQKDTPGIKLNDEPTYRENYQLFVTSRLLDGISLDSFKNLTQDQIDLFNRYQSESGNFLFAYINEKKLLEPVVTSYLINALSGRVSQHTKDERLIPYSKTFFENGKNNTTLNDDDIKAIVAPSLTNKNIYAATEENFVSVKMFNQITNFQQSLKWSKEDEQEKIPLKDFNKLRLEYEVQNELIYKLYNFKN